MQEGAEGGEQREEQRQPEARQGVAAQEAQAGAEHGGTGKLGAHALKGSV